MPYLWHAQWKKKIILIPMMMSCSAIYTWVAPRDIGGFILQVVGVGIRPARKLSARTGLGTEKPSPV